MATSSTEAPDAAATLKRDDDVVVVTNVQPDLRSDDETPLQATDAVIELMRKAAAANATAIDLFVLPELCPVGYSEDTFAKYLPKTKEIQKMFLDIDRMLAEAAKELKSHICYGTIGWEEVAGDGRDDVDDESSLQFDFFIRQVVVDPSGMRIAQYDKIHVCDYGDCAETRFFQRGSSLTSFSIRNLTFGIIVCADLRYPRLAQHLVSSHKIDVLLHPACFMRDVSFATWHAFRTTRAVENGVYVSSGNYAGEYFGNAAIIPPWVDHDKYVERELDKEAGYLTEPMSRSVLDHARQFVPFNRHAVEYDCKSCVFSKVL